MATPRQEDAPTTGVRPFWRGFLEFGLVQIPVELHSAESRNELDFDLLDRRDLAPVGYLKVNKETGEAVPPEEIVRGVEVAKGRHVIVTDAEIEHAAGKKSRSIEVVEFVPRDAIPPQYFERPIHLVAGKSGEKIYALLARALEESGKFGVARIVLRARESLAAIVAADGRLVLNLLRWEHELRPAPGGRRSPAAGKAGAREVAMARRLIEEMSGEFRPAAFTDRFRKELLALVRKRARTGSMPEPPPTRRPPARAANVVDLVALLEKSVQARKGAARPAVKPSARPAARRRRSA
ncbi:MAG: Ku protein [Thermoanaerobaculia bacterium]